VSLGKGVEYKDTKHQMSSTKHNGSIIYKTNKMANFVFKCRVN